MIRLVGLDLSIASTGVIDLRIGDQPDQPRRWETIAHRFQTGPGRTKHFRAQHRRMSTISAGLLGVLQSAPSPHLVVVEAPAYGSSTPYQHDVSGNWWQQVGLCLDRGLDVLTVTPHQLKIYATGSAATSGPNKVGKPEVAAAVRGRYGVQTARALDGNGTDVVDAFVLAALGSRVLGWPIEVDDLPASHLRALDKLDLSGILTGMPEGAW